MDLKPVKDMPILEQKLEIGDGKAGSVEIIIDFNCRFTTDPLLFVAVTRPKHLQVMSFGILNHFF